MTSEEYEISEPKLVTMDYGKMSADAMLQLDTQSLAEDEIGLDDPDSDNDYELEDEFIQDIDATEIMEDDGVDSPYPVNPIRDDQPQRKDANASAVPRAEDDDAGHYQEDATPEYLDTEKRLHLVYDRGTSKRNLTGATNTQWVNANLMYIEGVYERLTNADTATRAQVDLEFINFFSGEVNQRTIEPQHAHPTDATRCKYCNKLFKDLAVNDTSEVKKKGGPRPKVDGATGARNAGPRRHVMECARIASQPKATQDAQKYLSRLATELCDGIQKNGEICGAEFHDGKEMHDHLTLHFNSGAHHMLGHKKKCFFESCEDDDEVFTSTSDLMRHAVEQHDIAFPEDANAMHTAFAVWCDFCYERIPVQAHSEAALDHLKTHYENAKSIVLAGGFAPIIKGQQAHISGEFDIAEERYVAKHGFCPICLPDANLPWDDRLACFQKPVVLSTHLRQLHQEPPKKTNCRTDGASLMARYCDDSEEYHCPGSKAAGSDFVFCDYQGRMTAQQFWQHIETVHELVVLPEKTKAQRARLAKKTAKPAAAQPTVIEDSDLIIERNETDANEPAAMAYDGGEGTLTPGTTQISPVDATQSTSLLPPQDVVKRDPVTIIPDGDDDIPPKSVPLQDISRNAKRHRVTVILDSDDDIPPKSVPLQDISRNAKRRPVTVIPDSDDDIPLKSVKRKRV